ncbi:hypothetical protein L596_015000 [Steinernema carpocapsae]|uniref:UBA domain-containing protein n=1 Tax=Steinernema carpocapsae TaxID=34508 RepID=A0A4U5NEH1_STECR|nr:hypothetical protein L596_015000 [Steinernema carpocapsae]
MFTPVRGAYVVQSTNFFRNAPFSKFLFIACIVATIIGTLMHEEGENRYYLRLSDLQANSLSSALSNVSKLFYFADLQFVIPSACLIYSCRLVERQLGTSKFMNLFIWQSLISTGVLWAMSTTAYFGSSIIPRGPAGLFVAMYIVFLKEVPFLSYGSVFGIPLTVHNLPLLMISQFISFDVMIPVLASASIASFVSMKLVDYCGMIPKNKLSMEWFSNLLESSNGSVLPLAATIERQRIEAMDELERQMMRSQMNQIYGGNANPNDQPSYINRLFNQLNGRENRIEVPEESIQRLMDMGFRDREAVRMALIQSDNNSHEAANILLTNGRA